MVVAGRQIIESRRQYLSPNEPISPRVAGQSSDVVPGPASIAELARALMNNVDNIFEWVYNNVDFLPTYGLQKGALGALVDNAGSNFDQCELLVQLLTQAGYTAYYELGEITMNTAQLSAWLGTDPTNFFSSYDVFQYGGYPLSWSYEDSDYWITLSYMWVKCTIDGTDYLFDPSYKTWSTTTGIDLASAMGYVQSDYLADAEDGATVTDDYIQNANRTNVRASIYSPASCNISPLYSSASPILLSRSERVASLCNRDSFSSRAVAAASWIIQRFLHVDDTRTIVTIKAQNAAQAIQANRKRRRIPLDCRAALCRYDLRRCSSIPRRSRFA